MLFFQTVIEPVEVFVADWFSGLLLVCGPFLFLQRLFQTGTLVVITMAYTALILTLTDQVVSNTDGTLV